MVNLTPAPIEVYSSGGNPAAAAHLAIAENALQQQDLNNLHGGNPTTTITLPQAPTMGGQIVSPNSGPSVANSAYTTLINGYENAQYDHHVGGGSTDSLLLRLQKLVPNQKKNKSKSKSNNKSKSKSKNKSKTKSKNKSKTKSKNKSKSKSKNQKKNKSIM